MPRHGRHRSIVAGVLTLAVVGGLAREPAAADSGAADASPNGQGDGEASIDALGGTFTFGSYGRAQVDLDEDGNTGSNPNVVAFGPRLFEGSYVEIDLGYELDRPDGFGARILFTPAFEGPLAHRTGDFADQALAVRNLYAELWGFTPLGEGLRAWVGSRMYRGDDVYLLDWWPLDELNTIGGGVMLRRGDWDARVHVGVNRLRDDYQLQTIRVPGATFGTRERVVLDRQRLVASGRLAYHLPLVTDALAAKLVGYAELHRIPGGERIPPEQVEDGVPRYDPDEVSESLPGDRGWVLGGELGLHDFGPSSHLNLFVRYARGIAAFGELGVPFGTADDGSASGAEELRAALSANWEGRRFAVQAGAYVRRFEDADDDAADPQDFVEGVLAVRPRIFVTDHFHQALELSYQRHVPFGPDPETGRRERADVGQLTVMEVLSLGRGSYKRPELRLYYTLSLNDAAAQRRYPPGDARRPGDVAHFVGLSAEWWFNSSRY